jgi:hypothetical protein
MTLSERTPSDSPFAVLHTRQPSTILCKMGRIKTERDIHLDATRVNPYSDVARATNSDKTRAIIGKANCARSQ